MVVTSRGSLVAFVASVTTVIMTFAAYTFHDAPKMDPLPPKENPCRNYATGAVGFRCSSTWHSRQTGMRLDLTNMSFGFTATGTM
jgi:hypothetical protein